MEVGFGAPKSWASQGLSAPVVIATALLSGTPMKIGLAGINYPCGDTRYQGSSGMSQSISGLRSMFCSTDEATLTGGFQPSSRAFL